MQTVSREKCCLLLLKNRKAIVEGVNLVSRHTKPNAASPQGGIIKKEAPIHISNLMVVDGSGMQHVSAEKKRTVN